MSNSNAILALQVLSGYHEVQLTIDQLIAARQRAYGSFGRFPDPQGRRDAAGRAIPHDFVIMSPAVTPIKSVDDGLREIWPIVADVYAGVWDSETPPSVAAIQSLLARNKGLRD